VARILRAAGIDGWRANHPVTVGGRRYVIDFAFPGSMVAIEVDGFAHHSDVTRFQRDRQRQNDLVRAGWTVLRFTWADVTERPHDVVARVRTELARLQDGLPRYAR
jgi:very-short-patch-repair endonuclease